MPALQSFCIVADDLSGAADCAAAVAAAGPPVPVFLDATQAQGERLALDTDSRAMNAAHAVAATKAAFEWVARRQAGLVYKKIDSTLRGHVGLELATALRALPGCAAALVAPAFPQQGRALQQGRLLVHGRGAQGLGHDGDLVAMLQAAGLRTALLAPPHAVAQLRARISQSLAGGANAIVVDAEQGDELEVVASALVASGAPPLLAVGSAGLAKALAGQLAAGAAPAIQAAFRPGPVLTLVGSFSPASADQVAQVEATGAAQVLRLTASQWTGEQHAGLREDTLARARGELAAGRNVLLTIVGAMAQPWSRIPALAMAALAAPLLREVTTCVLTGGDTARAMFERIGAQRIDIDGEFEPGISVGSVPSQPGLRVVLKAGAFGDPLTLQRIIARFGLPLRAGVAAS